MEIQAHHLVQGSISQGISWRILLLQHNVILDHGHSASPGAGPAHAQLGQISAV